jgi:hypothetical protein
MNFCIYCSKKFKFNSHEGVSPIKRHLRTKIHIVNLKTRQNSLNINTKPGTLTVKEIELELFEAWASANIPLSKLQIPKIRKLLEKYLNINLKDESYYRKNVIEEIYIKESKEH